MDRRKFLRRLGAAGSLAALSPLVQACAPQAAEPTPAAVVEQLAPSEPLASPSPTRVTPQVVAATPTTAPPAATPTDVPPTPAPTVRPGTDDGPAEATARIALVKTTDRVEGLRRAIALLGINPVQNKSVFLKPNFNSADPTPGSTHPDLLRALVEQLYELGAAEITLADRSGMGNTRAVMERLGVFGQAAELGYRAVVLDELPPEEWEMVASPELHWSRGFPVPRMLLEADALINTCCLKTHRFGGHFTLALKNSVGYVARSVGGGHDYMSELHGSRHMRTMIAEINIARRPDLIVLDGVTAFTHGGPDRGTLADTQVMLAGTDPVAIDAVGVAILRLFGTTAEVSQGTVFEQEQIARAAELGLGVRSREQIELVTEDAEGAAYAEQILAML